MTKTFPTLLLLTLIATIQSAKGASGELGIDTEWGASLSSQAVKGHGRLGGEPAGAESWNWNLAYGTQKSTSVVSGVGTVVDKTYDISGGLGWMGSAGWGLSFSLDNSRTPGENLVAHGTQLSLTHLAGVDASRPGEHDLATSLRLGTTNYIAQYSGSAARARRTVSVSGSADLRQYLLGLSAEWSPVEAWSLNGNASYYAYNRNVAGFQTYLNSPTSLGRGLGAFGNTIGGLPRWSLDLDAIYTLSDHWEIEADEIFSLLAANSGQTDSQSRATAAFHFASHWTVKGGAGYDTSLALTEWMGLLSLAWGF